MEMDERDHMQMEYPLCDQTVTVYRLVDGQVCRQVLTDCYLEVRTEAAPEDHRQKTEFLLVVPGKTERVLLGDRVVPGEGPEEIHWDLFLPVYVKDLLVVSRVKRFFWKGKLSHLEVS